jgi:hypothetical protein
MSKQNLTKLCFEKFMEIKNMPKETRDFYEENTREQAANKDWNNCKKGRISATLIHDIDRWRKAKQMEKVWDICYKYKPESKAKALEHGIRNEPVAKREIESFFGVVIKQVGCVISGKFPFFCASVVSQCLQISWSQVHELVAKFGFPVWSAFKSQPSDLCFKWLENCSFCTAIHALCGSAKKCKLQTNGIVCYQQSLFTAPSGQ